MLQASSSWLREAFIEASLFIKAKSLSASWLNRGENFNPKHCLDNVSTWWNWAKSGDLAQ
jgi:hypothetical protein